MKKYIFLAITLFYSLYTFGAENKTSKITLSNNWFIQSSSKINKSCAKLSSSKQNYSGWYRTSVPSTVMGALIANGEYKGILEGTNYKTFDKSRFDTSWYFIKGFEMPKLNKSQNAFITFDGISYSANIWLNGHKIADKASTYGTFRIHRFDISKFAKKKNVLLVEVFRAQPGEPNIGFADWNPRPLDENMGIFRDVQLSITDAVSMNNSAVKSKVNTSTLKEAWLTIETTLTNNSTKTVSGKLNGFFEGKRFTVPVEIAANSSKNISVDSTSAIFLYIKNPKLWWCKGLGDPNMHTLDLSFEIDGKVSDSQSINFGIRDIKDYLTENGDRGFILNGRKVLLKGAGWTDDIFLRNDSTSNEIQARYVADMNLNTIRFENIWGTSQYIYDLCDRLGLMMFVGWSCQWEWEHLVGMPCDKFGGIKSEKDMNLIANSFKDQVLWLRNHPSIIGWALGSDKLPRPELEKKYLSILASYNHRPYIGSCKKMNSSVTGPSGTKMAGPYEYVGPNYWYDEKAPGGAFGFNTETGIGAQLPAIESIQKMIPADKLWPINDAWSYHCTNGTEAMGSLKELTRIITGRYGEASDLEDYLKKADLANYEGTRAMFEAFRSNVPKTTGIIQWMLNSAWPSFYWQLYDFYLVPTSAYYSVKKGNMPQQLIYDYVKKQVVAVNEGTQPLKMYASMVIYGIDGKKIAEDNKMIDIRPDEVSSVFNVPNISANAFLFLKLNDSNGNEISNNNYCLSKVNDEHDWTKSNWVGTPVSKFADFKNLSKLPNNNCKIWADFAEGRDNAYINVTIENNEPTVAFMINLKARYNDLEIITPAFWDDNFVTLAPGEKRTYKCFIPNCKKDVPIYLNVEGWNVKPISIVLNLK